MIDSKHLAVVPSWEQTLGFLLCFVGCWELRAGLLGAGTGRKPCNAFSAAAELESPSALQIWGIPQLCQRQCWEGKTRD